MIKIMKELKRHEIMRRIEQQDADRQKPTQAIPKACGFEADTWIEEKKVDLKKQSQFEAPALPKGLKQKSEI